MKTIIGAIALTLAVPAFAQGTPAPEAKQDCCEKMKAQGKECCCKDMAKKDHAEHGKHDAKSGEHVTHQH